jgi:hypothetical protein
MARLLLLRTPAKDLDDIMRREAGFLIDEQHAVDTFLGTGHHRAKHIRRLAIADCGLQIADCRLRIAECGLRNAECGLRNAAGGCNLLGRPQSTPESAICTLQTAI